MKLLKVSKPSWFSLIRRSDSGNALVETALTMPLLVLLLIGAVELGDLAYRATEMSNAARAAAQFAAMNGGNLYDCKSSSLSGGTCTAGSGTMLAAQQDAPRANETCTSFTVQQTNTCTCSGNGAACDGSTGAYACTSGKPKVLVTVNTSASCAGAVNVTGLFGASSFTLHGFAQEYVLGGGN
jgi:hypothetical protein